MRFRSSTGMTSRRNRNIYGSEYRSIFLACSTEWLKSINHNYCCWSASFYALFPYFKFTLKIENLISNNPDPMISMPIIQGDFYIFFTPVLPNPPAPLSVSLSSSTTIVSAIEIFSNINCATRSPWFTTKSSSPKLNNTTPTAPR